MILVGMNAASVNFERLPPGRAESGNSPAAFSAGMAMNDNLAVLFVCLGNICRSPLAEAAFRQEAQRIGLEVQADSAGLGYWHVGEAPDKRAQAVARRHGVDISGYRARQVRQEDFGRFSHIIACDLDNLSRLNGMRPCNARASLSLLLDHAE